MPPSKASSKAAAKASAGESARASPRAPATAPPLGLLKYLYVGTGDFERDLAYYRDVVGARVVWNFAAFGARVAAVAVSEGPLLLLADHRPAPSVLPVYAVEDLGKTVKALKKRGWKPESGPFGIPDGPCYLFQDPSGNQLAVFGNERPDALLAAHEDEQDPRAVRDE
jgi:predicted enzyme related to lactoylglutathione lyase